MVTRPHHTHRPHTTACRTHRSVGVAAFPRAHDGDRRSPGRREPSPHRRPRLVRPAPLGSPRTAASLYRRWFGQGGGPIPRRPPPHTIVGRRTAAAFACANASLPSGRGPGPTRRPPGTARGRQRRPGRRRGGAPVACGSDTGRRGVHAMVAPTTRRTSAAAGAFALTHDPGIPGLTTAALVLFSSS